MMNIGQMTMDAWLSQLMSGGARVKDGGVPEVIDFGQPVGFDALRAGFVAPVPQLGLISLTGADAAQFLHNQITNDALHLDREQARLAGYCTPKGRLLATFLMWKNGSGEDERITLQLPREILPAIQKRLQMFVLRSKVKLEDVSERRAQLGLGGAAAAQALRAWFPELGQPYAKTDNEFGSLIRVADAFGAPRFVWVTEPDTAARLWPELAAALKPVGGQAWRLSMIHAGVPQVTLPTQDQFVPQMVNLELIGGVNFQKGCYPGQEIVARSQYLGKLKRRMALATIEQPDVAPAPGMEVFSRLDPDQPCGMIVNAERSGRHIATPAGRVETFDCLVELKLAALEAGEVHLGSVEGPSLRFLPLPYALPGEETAKAGS